LIGLPIVSAALFARLDLWRARGELRLAQEDIARGRLEAARRRLSAIASRPARLGGADDYWLGICEALSGHPEAAVRAFARLPAGYPLDAVGAYHEAKANLTLGRLHEAERRLVQALARGGPGTERVRDLLSHVEQIEVRFDNVKSLLRASLPQIEDPLGTLREISNLELDRLPYDGLRATLDKAGQLAPQDDRVWLGKARLAIEDGRFNDAAAWLRRCRDAGPDAPVWQAWLLWARGAGRCDEVVLAARQLERAGELEPAERLELRAWLQRRKGDASAETTELESWLRYEPTATPAMERLAELAHHLGSRDRVTELRRRKAEVERAMEEYRSRLNSDEPLRTAGERTKVALLAEAAGRHQEARALYAWALKAGPADPEASESLVRLDRTETQRRQLAVAASREPWPEPEGVSPLAAAHPDAGPPVEIAFTDDAEAVGLRFVYDNAETPLHQLPEPFGGGLALLDYDGDGWLDVFCVQGGPFTSQSAGGSSYAEMGDRLFHNRGDGTFEDATDRSGISRFRRGHGHGAAVGDVDGDGWPDLFVTRWRSYALYRNRGDGTFADVTDSWGLGGRRDWPTSAALADLDGDGDLDLYVAHYAAWDLDNPRICRDPATKAYLNCSPLLAQALPDHLFRNDGGRFVDVTAQSGIVDHDGRGLGVAAADVDSDGKIDLFVANDSSANFLFRNLGGMRFEEIAHLAGVAGNASGSYQSGMGVAAGDLDGDGLLDLAVTNFYGESTTFFRNLGGGVFTDATASAGLAVATRRLLGFGVDFIDADNDGRLDLVSANGHVNDLRPNYPYRMPAQLLRSGPDGRLQDVSDRAGTAWQVPRMGRGLAVGDIDNDGRQDVLILSHNQPLAYLHNRTNGGRFLTLRLESTKSNRDAVGAKVTVIAGGRRLVAWRTGGGSYQSAGDPRLHFGLGQADRIEAALVTWPAGRLGRYLGLRAGCGYVLREGYDDPRPLPGFPKLDSRPTRP
jgi:tetratricopeptide (TPR) repeat protein